MVHLFFLPNFSFFVCAQYQKSYLGCCFRLPCTHNDKPSQALQLFAVYTKTVLCLLSARDGGGSYSHLPYLNLMQKMPHSNSYIWNSIFSTLTLWKVHGRHSRLYQPWWTNGNRLNAPWITFGSNNKKKMMIIIFIRNNLLIRRCGYNT